MDVPRMRFFMPDWDDRVDPGYNFITDRHSPAHAANPRSNDAYMWDIFGIDHVPFDGVLVSKLQVDGNKRKQQEVATRGIHAYLRLPESFPVLGDCGAFGYINQDTPPVHTPEILEYYRKAGVNYAVSIDHLVVQSVRVLDADGKPTKDTRDLTRTEKEQRVAITVKNAIEFWKTWDATPAYRDRFTPLAGVQGETPADYAQCLEEILTGANYKYIAVGGLVRRQTKDILKILREIHPLVQKHHLDVHIFGVFRMDAIADFCRLGVSSFDSASRLRKSWLSNHENYYFQQRSYTGLRVPQPEESTKTRQLVKKDPDRYLPIFQKLQQKCLTTIREFHNNPGRISVEDVANILKEYTQYFSPDLKLLPWYVETLTERPWQQCGCPICKAIGVEVIIFRGNNRNRRRGFHNVFVEYHELQKILANIGADENQLVEVPALKKMKRGKKSP